MNYRLFMHLREALEFYKQACDVYITCHLNREHLWPAWWLHMIQNNDYE